MSPAVRLQICAAALAAAAGCGGFGRVNQGQAVAYDRAARTVTLVGDSNFRDPARPRYDILPAVAVRIPEDPHEMGPEPDAGKLLEFDLAGRRAVVFDAAAGALRTVPFTPVSEQAGAAPEQARAKLPAVDRAGGTITLYDARERKIIVISVAPEHLALPDDSWRAGDQVRYYYKDPQQALRMMNVTRTDVNKGGK